MGSCVWDAERRVDVARGLAGEVVEALKLRSFAVLRTAQDDNAQKWSAELLGRFFAGDEVDLFEESAFLPAGAGEDAHSVFAHAWMAA
jgi:hypothetical protein